MTVQIADSLDMDLELVEIILLDEVDRGVLKKQEVKSPNGRLALAFWLKDDPEVAVAQKPKATTRVLPQVPAVPGAPLRKYYLAVACILENGGIATSAQLHSALKLKPTEYASQYLMTPIKNGALVKTGKNWTIGNGESPVSTAPFATPADKEGLEGAKPLTSLEQSIIAAQESPEKQPERAFIPPALHIQTEEISAPIAMDNPNVADDAPTIKCALWSDGVFEIRIGDQPYVLLKPAEIAEIRNYLNRCEAAR